MYRKGYLLVNGLNKAVAERRNDPDPQALGVRRSPRWPVIRGSLHTGPQCSQSGLLGGGWHSTLRGNPKVPQAVIQSRLRTVSSQVYADSFWAKLLKFSYYRHTSQDRIALASQLGLHAQSDRDSAARWILADLTAGFQDIFPFRQSTEANQCNKYGEMLCQNKPAYG
jgi:hypothetical protein